MADEVAPALTDETPAPLIPEVVSDTPAPTETLLPENLHVAIWDTPPSYLCLPCNYKDPDYPTLVTHLQTVHGLEPVLTIFARDILSGQAATFGLAEAFHMSEPTYRTEETQDGTKYICLWCERAGSGHWSYDKALFVSHLEQRHDGRLVQDKPQEQAGEGEVTDTAQPDPSAPPPSTDQPPEEGGSVPHASEAQGATEPGA
jgi:hypothetical protein